MSTFDLWPRRLDKESQGIKVIQRNQSYHKLRRRITLPSWHDSLGTCPDVASGV